MTLATEYFLSVFLAATATIQFAVNRGGFRGIMFSQNASLNRMLATILLLPPAILFFTWNTHNPTGIIEGAQQAGLFSLAVLCAGAVTIVITSALNQKKLTPPLHVIPSDGLEALKQMTFLQAIMRRSWKV